MQDNQKNENSSIDKYTEISTMSVEEYIKQNNISLDGLTDIEASRKLQKNGYNEIKQGKPKRWYNYFLESLFTPFNSILLGIALVLYYTDVVLSDNPSYANIIVIIALVLTAFFDLSPTPNVFVKITLL